VNRRKLQRLKTTFWVSSISIAMFISFYVDTGASVFERLLFSPFIFMGVAFSIVAVGFALGSIVVICEWVLKLAEKIENWLRR
jgi:hypothetical protein